MALQKHMELSPTPRALATGGLRMESFCFALKEKLLFDNFPKAPGIYFFFPAVNSKEKSILEGQKVEILSQQR